MTVGRVEAAGSGSLLVPSLQVPMNWTGAQLRKEFVKVVHSVIDHEGGVTGAEPLAVTLRDMPHREAVVVGFVVRPPEDRAAEILQVSTTTLWRRLKEFGVDGPDNRAVH